MIDKMSIAPSHDNSFLSRIISKDSTSTSVTYHAPTMYLPIYLPTLRLAARSCARAAMCWRERSSVRAVSRSDMLVRSVL